MVALDSSAMSCSLRLPFEERLSSANIIVVGEVLSEKSLEKKLGNFDTVAVIKVKEVLKGEAVPSELSLNYMVAKGEKVCSAGSQAPLIGYKEQGMSALFFIKADGDIYSTSGELGGGYVGFSDVKKDIEQIKPGASKRHRK